MNLLMLLTRLETGGAEKMALALAERLPGRGIDVVGGGVRAGGALSAAFARSCLSVHEPLARGRWDARCVWRVRRLIRRHAIDAVLVVDAVRDAMVCGVWGARLSGRCVARLLWCHASLGHARPGGRSQGFVEQLRRRAGAFDAIVAVTRRQRAELAAAGIDRSRTCVIANGVEPPAAPPPDPAGKRALRRTLNLPAEGVLLVQVANYWPERDPLWLLEALAQAREQARPGGQAVHLALVGRGMDRTDVLAAIDRHALRDSVTLTGPRRDVGRYLAAADAFVLASRHETLSLAVLEAMAAALPVVVADIPPFADVVRDGVEGLKCPTADAGALAAQIRRLADDAALRQRLGAAARARANLYSADRMADRFARLLRAARAARAAAR